jgi:hypothetical protein
VIARTAVHFAETEMTVGDEWAHAVRLGERQRLAIVAISVIDAAGSASSATPSAECCSMNELY